MDTELLQVDYTLRQATAEDVAFLFRVSTDAMRPVVEALHPGRFFDSETEFRAYQEKFVPTEIEIIQYKGVDIGRLRIVRSLESLYVGGIQILPEFQNRGIGTAILTDLIHESSEIGVPILLEVHEANVKAQNFYRKFGFVKEEQKKGSCI